MAVETGQISHLNTRLESKTLPIFLRNVELQDASAMASLLSDPRNASDPNIKPMAVSTAEAVITRMRESAAEPTVYRREDGHVLRGPGRVNLAVLLKAPEGEVMVGLGGYGGINTLERDGSKVRAGDVGVVIDAEYRGRGFATEALKLAMDWGVSTVEDGGPQFDLLTMTTLSENEAMVKLANEKLGLEGMGSERNSGFDDKLETYWELTPAEWKKVQKYHVI